MQYTNESFRAKESKITVPIVGRDKESKTIALTAGAD